MAKSTIVKNYFDQQEILSPIQYNLIKTLKKIGPLTRRDLVKKLRTPRTTIYDNLVKLQRKKFIVKFSRNEGKKGRPKVFWKIKG